MPPTRPRRPADSGAASWDGSASDASFLIDALEADPGWTDEIVGTFGSARGRWLDALRDLASASSERQRRGREVALVEWSTAHWSGEAWGGGTRLRQATAQLRQVQREGDPARFVGDVPDALALAQLVALLEDPSCVVSMLVGLEDDARGDAVLQALASLGNFGEEVIDGSWDQLEKRERVRACRLLSRTRGAWGASRLMETLDAHDVETRVAAARALAVRCEPEALGELVRRFEQAVVDEDNVFDAEVEALEDAIVAVARGSEVDLARVTATLSEWLVGAEESVRIGFSEILARLAAPARTDWILPILNDPSPGVRVVAARVLSVVAPEHATKFRDQVLGDDVEEVRMAGAVSLGEVDDPEGLDVLERLCGDRSEGVRTAALRSLALRLATNPGAVDADRGVSWVEAGLRHGGLSAMAAVELVPHLDGNRARPVVERLLADADRELVCAALASLGRHADPALMASVRKALDHPDSEVRIESARVLADRGVVEAVPAILFQVERERDPETRDALLGAVRQLDV